MKEVALEDWAKRLLEDQIARLGELRNASPRDPGFKLWRQTTLTVIQRVWPGNLSKSERFRRIPFSTPSGKTSRTQVRDYYERGCAEAISYLKGLMTEIENGGLTPPRDAPDARPAPLPTSRPAPVLSKPTDEPKDMEMLDEGLVGTGPLTGPLSREELDARSETVPPPQFVSPEFDREPDLQPPTTSPPAIFTSPQFEDEPAHRPRPEPAAVIDDGSSAHESTTGAAEPRVPPAAEPRAPREPAAAEPRPTREVARPASAPSEPPAPAERDPSPARPIGNRSPRAARRGDRRALKDMLGFGDEQARELAQNSAAELPEIDEPQAPARPGPAFGIPPQRAADPDPAPVAPMTPSVEPLESEEEEAGPSAAPDPLPITADAVESLEGEAETELDPEPDPDPFAHDEDEEADVTLDLDPDEGEVAEEFLRTSPVLSAQARPLNAPRHTRSAPGTETAVASALAALAADIPRLGVPEGHRAATRAALLGLGRQFDDHTANWLSIRQAVAMVLEYPALARRVIPLLVPYLDLE